MLRPALDKLEAALETPFVPGELETWFDAVASVLADLGPILRSQIARQHGAQFEQIVQESPALQRSVEQLQREDGEVVAAYESLTARVAALAKKAATVEPDEGLMSQEAAHFADDGVWFVVRVRKQDAAIRTWLGEAMNRETPAGD
jgi:hypothetical protein